MKPQMGFTIIELVVVITILGILAGMGIPKFMNMREDAERAVVEATSAAFVSAVSLLKTKAVVQRATPGEYVNVGDNEYYLIGANANPHSFLRATTEPAKTSVVAASASMSDGICVAFWNGLLEDGGPIAGIGALSSTNQIDFFVTFTAADCTYVYVKDPKRTISYAYGTGLTTLVNL
ncbi:MAG: MSHA pilin protein MshB [Candidatus Azotimanducaceae bacterium]|jgi:MSHA pilin protein MshB